MRWGGGRWEVGGWGVGGGEEVEEGRFFFFLVQCGLGSPHPYLTAGDSVHSFITGVSVLHLVKIMILFKGFLNWPYQFTH